MSKEGLSLSELVPPFPRAIVKPLREEFSISTAEEFVTAVAYRGEMLRKSLGIQGLAWKKAIGVAEAHLHPVQLRMLKKKHVQGHPTGVLFRRKIRAKKSIKHFPIYSHTP
jgi:hypothetical protein